MTQSIFSKFAQKYWELGFNVVPVTGKACYLHWSKWSHERQTQEELDIIIDDYKFSNSTGIGMICGAYGMALDLDHDDPRLFQEAMSLSPGTMVRRGRRGCAIIYAPSSEKTRREKVTPLEFISVGGLVVLPPSVHPKTGKAYEWVGHYNEQSLKELGSFDHKKYEHLIKFCLDNKIYRLIETDGEAGDASPRQVTYDPNYRGKGNRNDALTRHAYALAANKTVNGYTEEDCIDRLIRFDKAFHKDDPWFEDKTEPHRGLDVRGTASKFFKRAYRAAERRGDIQVPVVFDLKELELRAEGVSNAIKAEGVVVADDYKALIPPGGIIELFYNYCCEIAVFESPPIFLGGAFAFCAALGQNRIQYKGTWSNMYIISLAASAIGKSIPQKVIKSVLHESAAGEKMLGPSKYASTQGFLHGLDTKRERLDLYDEIPSLFQDITGRRSGPLEGLGYVLANVYTESSDKMGAVGAATDKARHEAMWNVCVTILGSGTLASFKNVWDKKLSEIGLGGRLLFMVDRDAETRYKDSKEQIFDGSGLAIPPPELVDRVNAVLNPPRVEHPKSAASQSRFDPPKLKSTNAQELRLAKMHKAYVLKSFKHDEDDPMRPMYGRAVEQIRKLMLVYAISQDLWEVTDEMIDWAVRVFDLSVKSIGGDLKEALAKGPQAKLEARLRKYLSQGKVRVPKVELRRNTINLFDRRKEWDEAMKSFQEHELIAYEFEEAGINGKQTCFVVILLDP